MKMHLLRHAKTDQNSVTGRDIDRKLLPKGIKQAGEMRNFLTDLSHLNIHCSTSARTRQTLDILVEEREIGSVFFTEDLYLCSHLELLHYVNQITVQKDLLLVGHNNGLSDFATYLTGEDIYLQTCAYVCLDIKVEHWEQLSKNTAILLQSYRPEVD